ncbi:DUF6160 family protein [Marinobacter sp.]|uniref:DUF6160 family protein n=1 Tax=Marinobacter sp. TaxID=50741 RepID=UPI003850AF6A
MNGLKEKILIMAILMASFGAQAQYQMLNDTDLNGVTGQGGVTIELDANASIGEIQYRDQGSLFMTDVQIGGVGLNGVTYADGSAAGTALDNLKIGIDIAGDGSDLGQAYGLAKINDPDVTELANFGDHGEVAPVIDDGDLVIALDSIDQNDGVDMALNIGRVSLADSNVGPGISMIANTGTVLMSNLHLNAQLGPIDIVIDGTSSVTNINAYFMASGVVSFDFIATGLEFIIHNGRGADVLGYSNSRGDIASFAHAQIDIGPHVDSAKGLRVEVTDFSGDVDLEYITFGTAPSIGNVYLTDLSARAYMNVYGH